MPGLDGTGPFGDGPLTGSGEGYCVLVLSGDGVIHGYVGSQGRPFTVSRHDALGGQEGTPPFGWPRLRRLPRLRRRCGRRCERELARLLDRNVL
ncbi:MAG TPA: hypothetical protein ENL34_05830 [Chloroflexi bacterium]|nr:hypothetical protein [Chloroflexota bacterium]